MVHVEVVRQGLLQPFLHLTQSPILDFQCMAFAAFSSFSLYQANKSRLVKECALA
jgi:hypothetical protein